MDKGQKEAVSVKFPRVRQRRVLR